MLCPLAMHRLRWHGLTMELSQMENRSGNRIKTFKFSHRLIIRFEISGHNVHSKARPTYDL